MGRARLTRRQRRQYQDIIGGDGSAWAYPGPGFWLGRGGASPRPWVGNGWCALAFARKFGGRDDVDLKRLQLQVIRSGDPKCAYEFARDVPGANVRRLQEVVITAGDPAVMRTFAKNIPGANVRRIEAMLVIADVMGV